MDSSGNRSLSSLILRADKDRRAEPRLGAEVLGLDVEASLTQGIYVRVLNVSSGGALVELQEWIRPGTRSSLKLSRTGQTGTAGERMVAIGQIVRCWVDRLAPLRYRAAMVFTAAPPVDGGPGAPPETDVTALLERSA
ncbi:MAG: hypothetical protein R2708_22960 [Vicinamibacterales bacterium]